MFATDLLLINLASCLFMTGVIWFVQVVHYPAFSEVGETLFGPYHENHSRRTTAVVMGPMILELVSAIGLIPYGPPAMSPTLRWIGLGLVVVIWLSTAFLQVPMHDRLASGFVMAAHQRLCRSNWVRTVAWTIRSALLIHVIAKL